MFNTGTDNFRVLLRLCRLLNPSSMSRRTTRSSTSDWEMPKSSNVCGIDGLNDVLAGARIAAMRETKPHCFIGRIARFVYTLSSLHARGPNSVNLLVKFRQGVCWGVAACLVFVCFNLACLQLAAATQADQLFRQAQKAERAGEIVQAYLLYAEAAAADPTNIDYWTRAQALRPAASLVDPSPPKLGELSSDKIDRTLFGNIAPADLEAARKPLPPPQLAADPGQRDYDFRGDSRQLWEQVAASLNLKVLFDTAYRPTKAFHFELT